MSRAVLLYRVHILSKIFFIIANVISNSKIDYCWLQTLTMTLFWFVLTCHGLISLTFDIQMSVTIWLYNFIFYISTCCFDKAILDGWFWLGEIELEWPEAVFCNVFFMGCPHLKYFYEYTIRHFSFSVQCNQ